MASQKQQAPLVGIIMGSDSDLPVMQPAADILKEFGIDFELTVVSAHRTPERMFEYAKGARGRGLKVIIAGAGGAAHLPGMVASLTSLPVIGVPVESRALRGWIPFSPSPRCRAKYRWRRSPSVLRAPRTPPCKPPPFWRCR